MSQLIQMRQRIKAVTTIKKITSAMRLISRSMHTRLARQKESLTLYTTTLSSLFKTIYANQTTWRPEQLFPTEEQQPRELIIIMGSQKGMCGTYNTGLFYWMEHHKADLKKPHVALISVGKKVTDHLQKMGIQPMHSLFDVRMQAIDTVVQELLDYALPTKHGYTSVRIISNHSKTFFTHELHETTLIPLSTPATENRSHKSDTEDYQWSHAPEELLTVLAQDYLTIMVRSAVFESLVGEQAARFIAMDNATRNAKGFLTTMNLQYNKLRQAKITKELTELAGAFESQSFV